MPVDVCSLAVKPVHILYTKSADPLFYFIYFFLNETTTDIVFEESIRANSRLPNEDNE